MRMMNIVLSFNLLFSTLISVCVTARLTDDQLAQILSDKLSTGPLRDSREYPSIDDLTEFDRRLVALEKIDEVADRLLDDELQTDEDFADGPKYDSNRMVQKSEDSGKDFTIDSDFGDTVTDIFETGSEPKRYLFDVTDMHRDDAFNEQQKIKSSLKVCIAYSYTQQEFEKCQRRHGENKFNTIHALKEKRVGFSTCGTYGNRCKTKEGEKEIGEEKRNPFCGRFGCRGKRFEKEIGEEKRNPFCGRFGCRGKRFEKEIGEEKRNPFGNKYYRNVKKETGEEKQYPGCFGCRGKGKRFEEEIGEEKRLVFHNKNQNRRMSKNKQGNRSGNKSYPKGKKIVREIRKEKGNPVCGEHGCLEKRFAFFNKYPGKRQRSKLTDKKHMDSIIPDKRGLLRNIDQPIVLFQTSTGFEESETDSSDDREEYYAQNELKDVHLKEDLRRVIGSICNTSINGCQFKKGRRKLKKIVG